MSEITKEFFLDIEKNYDKKSDIEKALYTCWSSGEDGYDRAGYEEQAYRGAAELAQLVTRAENAEAERDALKAAIEEIKLSVVGDKFPNWTSFTRVTEQRMRIADICDNALSAKGER